MPVDPVPENMHSVTPSLVCSPAAEAIAWYVKVFGAEEIVPRMTSPDGLIGHSEVRIGDTVVMVNDPWPDSPTKPPTELGGTSIALFVYGADADLMWERALENGAEVVFPFEKQFYGHEGGRVQDPFGHQWGIGRVVEIVDDEEMGRRTQAFFDEQGG